MKANDLSIPLAVPKYKICGSAQKLNQKTIISKNPSGLIEANNNAFSADYFVHFLKSGINPERWEIILDLKVWLKKGSGRIYEVILDS